MLPTHSQSMGLTALKFYSDFLIYKYFSIIFFLLSTFPHFLAFSSCSPFHSPSAFPFFIPIPLVFFSSFYFPLPILPKTWTQSRKKKAFYLKFSTYLFPIMNFKDTGKTIGLHAHEVRMCLVIDCHFFFQTPLKQGMCSKLEDYSE